MESVKYGRVYGTADASGDDDTGKRKDEPITDWLKLVEDVETGKDPVRTLEGDCGFSELDSTPQV